MLWWAPFVINYFFFFFFSKHLTNFPTIYFVSFFLRWGGGGAQTGGPWAIALYTPYKSGPGSSPPSCYPSVSDRPVGTFESWRLGPSSRGSSSSRRGACLRSGAACNGLLFLLVKGQAVLRVMGSAAYPTPDRERAAPRVVDPPLTLEALKRFRNKWPDSKTPPRAQV